MDISIDNVSKVLSSKGDNSGNILYGISFFIKKPTPPPFAFFPVACNNLKPGKVRLACSEICQISCSAITVMGMFLLVRERI